jgi:hypothetical protein
MYAIYGNICHQYTPNVTIYSIHGSYMILWDCTSPVTQKYDLIFDDISRCELWGMNRTWNLATLSRYFKTFLEKALFDKPWGYSDKS